MYETVTRDCLCRFLYLYYIQYTAAAEVNQWADMLLVRMASKNNLFFSETLSNKLDVLIT